jgi:membrane protease YdiL (CAAX protease family)
MKAHRVAILFTALALGFALVYWVLITLAQYGALPFAMGPFDFSLEGNSIPGLLLEAVLRIFGPAVAAILTIALLQGKAGFRGWGAQLLRWRQPGYVYLLVFLGPLAVSAVIVAVGYPLGMLVFDPSSIHLLKFIIFFVLMVFLDGPLGEELGWRGLLLPELLRSLSPLKAGLLVGVIWYLWHIPLYLADGKDLHPVGYFVNVVALSVIFTWFYLRSGRSLFITILFHATSNYGLFLLIKCFSFPQGIGTPQVIYDAILVVLAVAAAYDMHRTDIGLNRASLSRPTARQ